MHFKNKIKSLLGEKGIRAVKGILELVRCPLSAYRRAAAGLLWRQKAVDLSKSPGGLRLHLGCGDQHLPGMLNCEYRATKAADVIMDCGRLERFNSESVSLIFSHAFFEHLYRAQQAPLLGDCHRVLKEGGAVLFMGLPDFKVIAQAYLNHLPGHPGRSEFFDLHQVYRYTHGEPEIAPAYWLEQLHKSLFDREYLQGLLSAAGFKHWAIFNYAYKGERIPLNLGFAAWKTPPGDIAPELRKLLPEFRGYFSDQEHIFDPGNLAVSPTPFGS